MRVRAWWNDRLVRGWPVDDSAVEGIDYWIDPGADWPRAVAVDRLWQEYCIDHAPVARPAFLRAFHAAVRHDGITWRDLKAPIMAMPAVVKRIECVRFCGRPAFMLPA